MANNVTYKAIDENRDELIRAARKIWENPEVAYKEYIAADTCEKLLKDAGFEVQRPYGGMENGMRAQYGSGKPVVALIGEFDALPALSQKDSCYREPIVENGPGHGCGHCLMCPANIGALMAIRDEMKAKNLPGTIVFIATPAEETCHGKVEMAAYNAFDGIDIALCWHPGRYNRSSYSRLVGANTQEFKFYGKSAHAGCDPHLGRSALDAVELTNVGANYLREHVPMDVRIHYCITNGGGAPNVVPDYASVKYTFRALDILTMQDVEERLHNIAKGAAMMTGTRVEVVRYGGCYPVINNHVVADVIHESLQEIKMEEWSQEEIEYARELNKTIYAQWQDCVKLAGADPDTQLHVGVMPIDEENDYGSTDMGDISYMCPSCFYKGAGFPIGASYHTWQVTAVTGMSIGHKSMMNGARVTALAALKFLENPELVEKAWAEFRESTKGAEYHPMMAD